MSIQYNGASRLFMISAGEVSCAFAAAGEEFIHPGILISRHYGARINRAEDIPYYSELGFQRRIGVGASRLSAYNTDEYPGWNAHMRGSEPALKCTFADGTRDLRLQYRSHEISGDELRIRLADVKYPLEVELIYKAYEDCGIIERSAVITNRSDASEILPNTDVTLEVFAAAQLHIPYRDELRLTSLTGAWGEEYRITREKIRDGQTVLQTRTILSGADAVPFFAIDEGDANERRGGVHFGTLLWSGTHKLVIEKFLEGQVSVTAGVNNFDCRVRLKPGESYATPVFAFGYTEQGFGGVSRAIHAYERRHIMSSFEAERLLPVVFNAYGSFFAKINEEKIMSIIPVAQEVGVEALIVDAGWSGVGEEYAKGMGVWNQNRERFPNGMRGIADELHRRGMKFGLWMEPECIHQDSDIYREHPEWVIGYPGRGGDLDVMRYVLNFALDEVCEYILDKICTLIEECGVDYFKIDFNRRLAEVGCMGLDEADKPSVWIRYTENLSKIFMTVKERYPELLFENCAGGGMRTDVAMLRFSGRINRSDNQDPLDILKIHEGFSYFMLPKLAGGGCHISDVYTRHHNNRVSPMKYQATIAMMGSMAIGKNLALISDEEKAELIEYVKKFKEIRHIVQLGDIYRLASAYDKPYAAFQYVYGDESVVFLLGQSQQFMKQPENLRLDGLDESALYRVFEDGSDKSRVLSGRALMKLGLHVTLEGDFDSKIYRVNRLDSE